MKFFDKNFFKFTFQFLAIVFFGVLLVSYISGLNLGDDIAARVVDGR